MLICPEMRKTVDSKMKGLQVRIKSPQANNWAGVALEKTQEAD